jgi:MFS family permease
MCVTIFFSVANASMSSIALPDIARDFRVAPDDLSWVVTAYLIPFATGTIVYGRLADMFGTRRMYLIGLVLFTVASFASAAAPSFGLLIVARAVMGMGGTAVPSLSLATIIRTTSRGDRAPAMGATVMTVGLGFATGPILGGWLVDMWGWHGPFLGIAVCSTLVLPVAFAMVPGVPGIPGQRFDIPGAVSAVGAVTGTVLAINRLPAHPIDAIGLAGAIAAPLFLAGLVFRIRTAAEPFIHREVAANTRFWGLAVVGFTAQGTHFAVVVMVPLLLAGQFGMDTIRIGLYLLPGALAIAAFGMMGGRLLNRVGARPLLVVGTFVMLSGTLLGHLVGVDWEPAGVAMVYMVVAAGYGMVQSAVITAAAGALPERLAGLASGSFNLVFFLGGAVTVALQGAVLRSRGDAADAWDPLFTGAPVAFSDALIIVVVLGVMGLALALRFAPSRDHALHV